MGLRVYILVLPFFAWMIVLVVSTSCMLISCHCQTDQASLSPVLHVTCHHAMLVQAVYSSAYVMVQNSENPAKASMYANTMNVYNTKIGLAAQKLVLSTTEEAIALQRTQ